MRSYADLLIPIAQHASLSIHGVIDGLESGYAAAVLEKGKLIFKKYDTTGTDFDIMGSLCLKFKFEEPELCSFLTVVLSRACGNAPSIPVGRHWDNFSFTKDLYLPLEFCYYRYIYIGDPPEDPYPELLSSLSIAQLVYLWEKYLEEGVNYEEFDRLYELFEQRADFPFCPWLIALRIAIEKLHMNIQMQEDDFYIFDSQGNRKKLGFNRPSSAEKLFLKLLFPV
ncbi:hypothetical protein SDC9_180814 [bioreactor metagenome]|uniref:Uncharacterized protein n=1 Tax=bioreactor metagenome TaxID=1076179 RepID=A0A645H5J5_9ZZZZ